MNKKILLLLFTMVIVAGSVFAQNEDSTDSGDWGWHNRHKHKWHFNMFKEEIKGNPTIKLNYGFSEIKRDDFSGAFAKPNMLELQLGYTHQEKTFEADDILEYNFKYLEVSNFTPNLGSSVSAGELNTNSWKFGFGRDKGYGYKLGQSAIIPYYGYSVDWTKIDFKNAPANSGDLRIANFYNKTFRFGTSFQGGIKFQIIPSIAIDASYQRSVVFERHLFWKWLGSVVIESAGQVALDKFVDEILESSPYAAPIANFLLKNALAYGFYELRQKKMNWPFETAPPITFNQFKIGLTFVL